MATVRANSAHSSSGIADPIKRLRPRQTTPNWVESDTESDSSYEGLPTKVSLKRRQTNSKTTKKRKRKQGEDSDEEPRINPHLLELLNCSADDDTGEIRYKKIPAGREKHEEPDEDSGNRTFVVFDPESGMPLNVWTTKSPVGAVKRHYNSKVGIHRYMFKLQHSEPATTQSSNQKVPESVRQAVEDAIESGQVTLEQGEHYISTYYDSHTDSGIDRCFPLYVLEWGKPHEDAKVYLVSRERVRKPQKQEITKGIRVKAAVVREPQESIRQKAVEAAKPLAKAVELAERYRKERGFDLDIKAKFRSQRKTRQLRLLEVLTQARMEIDKE